jgi:RNA polymerase sigma-70 factor (ECF subfamily)
LEALNTGFYKVYKNIKLFDSTRGSLYTWIRTIIINGCLDQIKARQSFGNAVSLDSISPIEVQAEVITKLDANEILQLVRKLPPATQAVFNLYVIEGYTHNEIAKIVGTSEGTSKWHLSEARKKLKQMITVPRNE